MTIKKCTKRNVVLLLLSLLFPKILRSLNMPHRHNEEENTRSDIISNFISLNKCLTNKQNYRFLYSILLQTTSFNQLIYSLLSECRTQVFKFLV